VVFLSWTSDYVIAQATSYTPVYLYSKVFLIKSKLKQG